MKTMQTTALTALTRKIFTKRNSQSGKKENTMKAMTLLKSLVVVAALGMSAPAYAGDWVDVYPGEIDNIEIGNNYTRLAMKKGFDNTCGGTAINVDHTSPKSA